MKGRGTRPWVLCYFMPRIKAGLYQLGSRGGSIKKKKKKKGMQSRPGTTLYEWLPTCQALSGQVGVPLEHIAMESQSPGEIKRREVSWARQRERVGLLLLQLFPNGGATDIVFVTLFRIAVGTAIAWCGGRCAMHDGHCLNILLFWRRSTAAWVFRVGACFEVSLFCPPFPTRPRP